MARYRYFLTDTVDNTDFGYEADYEIFVTDEDDSSQEWDGYDIGIHTEGFLEIMTPLEIQGEDMENVFTGYYIPAFPTFESVATHLESFGWILDKDLEE